MQIHNKENLNEKNNTCIELIFTHGDEEPVKSKTTHPHIA